MTVRQFLNQAIAELAPVSPTPRLDAEVLAMHVCALTRSALYAHPDRGCNPEQEQRLRALIARRKQGEPVAYLTGRREFWSLKLNVSAATLIPRPETELLVEQALTHIPQGAAWTVADLGTGCGAIALALAHERPTCRVIATDNAQAALDLARENATALGLTHVAFRHGNWFEPLTGELFDMVVSNPPYVPRGDPHLTRGDVRFEPASALAGGADGLDAIRRIAAHAKDHLKPGGWLLLEHGYDQAGSVNAILRRAGYRDIACHRDLAGHDRVTACRAGPRT